jgi:CrcB protein
MNLGALCLIALGGALGSVARALVGWAIPAGRLPWATMLINFAGSLLIGWLMGRLTPMSESTMRHHSFWVVGLCGGFTTFSAFSWQTVELLQKNNWGAALANVALSVVLCLVATWAGWRLAR